MVAETAGHKVTPDGEVLRPWFWGAVPLRCLPGVAQAERGRPLCLCPSVSIHLFLPICPHPCPLPTVSPPPSFHLSRHGVDQCGWSSRLLHTQHTLCPQRPLDTTFGAPAGGSPWPCFFSDFLPPQLFLWRVEADPPGTSNWQRPHPMVPSGKPKEVATWDVSWCPGDMCGEGRPPLSWPHTWGVLVPVLIL